MYPILFSIGPLHVFSFSLFLLLSWGVFSFIFWNVLRSEAVHEEHIFDLMFYATLVTFASARIVFVLSYQELFTDNLLKIATLWVQPGLSLYGGLAGGVGMLIHLCRQYKVRIGYVFDALGLALPPALLVGAIGTQLDGSQVGKLSPVPWAVWYVGQAGKRHPVGFYEAIAFVGVSILLGILYQRAKKDRWPYGVIGIWFFVLFSISMFALEFFKETALYWKSLSANQWVLIVLFSQSLGAFYVRGGGRELLTPLVQTVISRGRNAIRLFLSKGSGTRRTK